MPVTAEWLPIEDSFERQLVKRLVADGRSFIKGLRYNMHRGHCVATATLTDTGGSGPLLFIVRPALDGAETFDAIRSVNAGSESIAWTRHAAFEAMPALPEAPGNRPGRASSDPGARPLRQPETDTKAT